MQQMPREEQQAILDERQKLLEVLHERGLIDAALRDRGLTLALGKLWTLEQK